MSKVKQCSKCKKYKTLNEFYIWKNGKDGFRTMCKKCHSIYCKQYREKHKLYLLKKQKAYYQLNKNKLIKQRQIYYEKNKEVILEYHKQYEKMHRQEINKKSNHKYKTNINFRISVNIRGRLNKVLKRTKKSKSTLKLLGCSFEELKNYLESKFKPGMNWKNHGNGFNEIKEWHIDHIKPCASFDLSKPEEQEKCFRYTNLQPLWAEENWKKHDKY